MKISALDAVAALLMAVILLAPLTAGMLAAQRASDETKAKSQAPVDPAQEQRQ